MATARSSIPHGSILASLRQRQMDEYNAAEEKKKKKAAFTNQMVQLGGMAAGAALAGPLGMGVMAGVGMGGTAGGLLGNAATGTPVSMNQGINAAMQVGGLMDRNARTDAYQERTDMMGTDPASGMKILDSLNLGENDTATWKNQNLSIRRTGTAGQVAFDAAAALGGNIGEGAAAARVGGGGVIDSLGGTPRTPFDYSRQGNVVEPYYKRDLLPVRGSGVGQPSGSLAAVQNTQDTFGGGVDQSGGIVQVNTPAEAELLPIGTQYKGPDGILRIR